VGAMMILGLIVLGVLQGTTLWLAYRLFRWAGRASAHIDTLNTRVQAIGEGLAMLPIPDLTPLATIDKRIGMILVLLHDALAVKPADPLVPAPVVAQPKGLRRLTRDLRAALSALVAAPPVAAPPPPPAPHERSPAAEKPGRRLMREVRAGQRARGLP
jgi:hypothetical protein